MAGKTRILTSIDEEDPFFVSFISLSLRQFLTILGSAAVWMMFVQLTMFITPLTAVFAGLIWSWLLFGGLFLALAKKDGRPFEEYLSHWFVYTTSTKIWIPKDPNAKYGTVEDANWSELDEDGPPRW